MVPSQTKLMTSMRRACRDASISERNPSRYFIAKLRCSVYGTIIRDITIINGLIWLGSSRECLLDSNQHY